MLTDDETASALVALDRLQAELEDASEEAGSHLDLTDEETLRKCRGWVRLGMIERAVHHLEDRVHEHPTAPLAIGGATDDLRELLLHVADRIRSEASAD